MKMKRNSARGTAGHSVMWILAAVLMIGVVIFLISKRQPAPPPPVVVAPTPIPITPVPATPPPEVVKATPPPPPVVMATPPPTPTPTPPPTLDLATLARVPALWPAQVVLSQPHAFPMTLNGRVAGQVTAPAATALRLLRLQGAQAEVEFQNARHWIPAAATDVLVRAQAAFRQAGYVLPQAAATPSPAMTAATTMPAQTPPPAAGAAARIGQRLDIDVVRQKRSRIEGGDFDDKKDRITLKVKLQNTDTAVGAENLKGEIFVFAESILERGWAKMLQTQSFTFSLPPRGTHEFLTDEVETAYDLTGARFGYRYDGWLLRIRDSAGTLLAEKSSSPTMAKNADKLAAIPVESDFDRTTFKVKPTTRR